ncbi:hypothetical protein MPER_09455, partial [Moniliophthora perniciosa FA553]
MHSILDIGGPDARLRVPHASFGDFLRDATRSGYFFVGDKRSRHGFLARQFLCVIEHYSHLWDGQEDTLPDV